MYYVSHCQQSCQPETETQLAHQTFVHHSFEFSDHLSPATDPFSRDVVQFSA